MINKKSYLQILSDIDAIFKKYPFLAENRPQLENLKSTIEDFAFRVILIGGFSSGKSALLNRLVERPLFKEDLGPETAVPAEVSWAPVEDADILYENGSLCKADIETATANPPKDACCIQMRVDHPFLKQRPELILVDFPGFDSNVEAHNKAINAYLSKGCAFILLVPAQNGALTQSDIRFLREASQYPQNLICLVSKSDVCPKEKCEEIVTYVQNEISAVYGEEVPVIPVSSREDTREEFELSLSSAIDRFNPQELFDLLLAPAINEQLDIGVSALENYIAASKLDARAIDEKIAAAEEERRNLARQLEKERRALDSKYRNEIIPSILGRLEDSLRGNVNMLAEAAAGGQERFADAVQSIVRPILTGVPGEIQTNLRDVISEMPIERQPGKTNENSEAIRDALLNVVDVISSVIPLGKESQAPKRKSGGINPIGKMLPGIGAGVMVGTFVNPLLGILVGIAPTLINLIFGGQKQQADPLAEVRARVEAQAIPALMSRLGDQIIPAVMQTRDSMFEEIKNKIDENMSAAQDALEQAKKEKENLQTEYEDNIASIKADVETLKNMVIRKEGQILS